MNEVFKIKTQSNIKQEINELVKNLGGFKNFINQGDTVLLKPNYNTADPFPASSQLDFLKSVTELVYENGAKLVIIAESSTMTLNTRKVLEKRGVFELQNMDPAPRIIVLEEREWIKKQIPNAKYLKKVSVPKILDKVDKHILLPCLKTHSYAQFTGSLKLSVAYMKPSQRVKLHMKNLQEKIAELNRIINIDLIIMDARKCFINKGPCNGDIREPGLILVSTDRIAIDIEGIKIIQGYEGNSLKGIDHEKMVQIKLAKQILK